MHSPSPPRPPSHYRVATTSCVFTSTDSLSVFLSHLGSFHLCLSPPFLTTNSPLLRFPHSVCLPLSSNLFLPPPPLPSPLSLSPSLLCLLQQKNPAQTPACVCVCTCVNVCVSHDGRTVSEALTQSRAKEEVRFYFSFIFLLLVVVGGWGRGGIHGCAKLHDQNTGCRSVASQPRKHREKEREEVKKTPGASALLVSCPPLFPSISSSSVSLRFHIGISFFSSQGASLSPHPSAFSPLFSLP